ncbi:MAG: hypothetical protein ACREX4_24600 [Gammaproteobacteria bacterium]
MESPMESSVAKPMETVAEMPAAKPEAKTSAETPSMETVAVESVPKLERKPGLGGGDHSE